jgi:hypothetical protein
MTLTFQLVPDWPKLAWVARCNADGPDVLVRHGSHVETGDGWCVEGVWTGDFDAGDFDASELVFGSGVRCCNGNVVFVSTSTMLDRLWHCRRGGQTYVANSLPAMLACAEVSLSDDYANYPADIDTLTKGMNDYTPSIPASPCQVSLTYYRTLV